MGKAILILMAEDDAEDRMLVQDAWTESRLANELRFVKDGEELMDYLRGRGAWSAPGDAPRPDLILLDLNLPDVDGLELLRELQRDPDCASIPVVVVSADATPARIEDALAAGARRYMTKPLNLGSFLGMLDDLLQGIDSRYS